MLFFQKRESDNLKFSFKIGETRFQLLQYSEDIIDLRIENKRFFELVNEEKSGKLKRMKEEYKKKENEKKKKEEKKKKQKDLPYEKERR